MNTTTLDELWKIARQYGRVNLYTNDDGSYHACIKFDSIAHTTLQAASDFVRPTPHSALQMAIGSAQAIVDSVSKVNAKLPDRKLLK